MALKSKIPLILIAVVVVLGLYTFLSSLPVQHERPLVKSSDYWLNLVNEAGLDCRGPIEGYWPEDFQGYFDYQVEIGQLIVLPCDYFAYQNNYVAIYVHNDGNEILSFDIPDDSEEDGWQTTQTPIGLSYLPEDQTFIRQEKSRGLGDCGFWATYTWDEAEQSADFLEWEFTECIDIYE